MNKNRLSRLADALTAELHEYQKLKLELAEAQSRFMKREPDRFELRAIGSILHDLYQGAESICTHIAKEVDQRVPQEATWHRELLDQMAKPIHKTRPPVLQSETVALLEDYRRFRHRFRNIYGFALDWELMKPLLNRANTTIDKFAGDIEQFIAFLRMFL